LVTETAQYSALHCFFNFKQNNEYLLISNTLRFICSILLALAFYFILHCSRHTFATRCIESQCDYKTVSAILGHSNVATTLNLYVHPNIHQKKKCIERMNKFLGIAEQ